MDQIEILNVTNLPEYLSDSAQANIPAKKIKEMGIACKARLDALKELRASSRYDQERQLDFDAYHLVPPKKSLPYAGYPNLACPLPRIAADTFHSNMLFTFGGQTGHFQILPDFLSKSHIDVARRAADYMTYVVNYESGLYEALDKAGLNCTKYENGFLKATYVKQDIWETHTITTTETVLSEDPDTHVVTPKQVKKKKKEKVCKTIFDGVKVESVSPVCCFASPLYATVKEAVDKDYFFEVHSYPRRFMEEHAVAPKDAEAFFDADQVKLVKDVQRANMISRLESNKQQYDGIQIDRELENTPVELAEAHFRSDVDDDGLAEKMALVFETTTGIVLRVSFAECRVVKLSPYPVDDRWDSESVRKVISTFVTEWEAIHNQRVAKGQWSNLPFFFFKAGGRFNPQMITLMPGKGYPVDDPGSVVFPQPPPPDMSYFNEEKLIMDLVDRILGLGDVIQGIQKGGDASATNTLQSVQRAGIRLATPLNRIGGALEELLGHIWDLNKQCGPEFKEFRVAGIGDGTPIFSKITSADYETQVAFKLNMATMYDVQQVRDTALMNYKTFISNPLFMQNPASFYQLTQQTMDAVGLKIKIPAPDQAKAKSVFEIIDLIDQGTKEEAQVGIDPDEHMSALKVFMNDDEFMKWPLEKKMSLMHYYDTCQILKQTLQTANLNNSGVFEGMNGVQPPPQAPMTATRNPSQTFNNLRVGQTPKSAAQQPMNAVKGAMAPQPNQGGGGY